MLSEEEKKAMNNLNFIVVTDIYDNEVSINKTEMINEYNHSVGIVLNLITKLQKEVEHQKEKRENQKLELAILNEKQKEFNKLRNTVNSYKGQFKRQQAEIEQLKQAGNAMDLLLKQKIEELEKKDKIIKELEEKLSERNMEEH